MKYIAILLLLFATTSNAQWHRLSGPPAAGPMSYAQSSDGKTTFAATPDGIWRSTSVSGPWAPVAFRGQNIWVIGDFNFSGQGDVLFATIDTALARSLDSGKTWQPVWVHNNQLFITGISQEGTRLTLATDTGLMRSTDLGTTWMPSGTMPGKFFITPSYFFAISNAALWRMARSGGPWEKTSYPFWQIPISITSAGNNIFIGAVGRVDLSTDGGNSWLHPVNQGLDTTKDAINSLGVNGLTMVAAGPMGIIASTDGARSWQLVSDAIDGFAVKYIDNQFVLSRSAGLFRSSDGLKWQYVPMQTLSAEVQKLVVGDNNALFAYTSGAVFRSSDRGATWSAPGDFGWINGIVTSEGTVFALGQSSLWISRFGNWVSANWIRSVKSVAAVRGILFAMDSDGGIYRSNDTASTWTPLLNTPVVTDGHLFSVSDTLYELGSQLYVSIDSGRTWTLRSTLPFHQQIFEFTASQNLIAVLMAGKGFLSSDYGHTWEELSTSSRAVGIVNGNLLQSTSSPNSHGVYNVTSGYRLIVTDSVTSPADAIASDNTMLYLGTYSKGLWAAPLDQLPLSVRAEYSIASMPMKLYPNPSRTRSNLHFDLNDRGDAKLEIFNLLGETVMLTDLGILEGGSHDLPIETTWLTNGIYTVRISTENSVSKARLIVSH